MSLKRLSIDFRMVRYYDSFTVDLTAPKLRLTVLDNLEIQCKAMEKKSKQSSPDVPNLGKNTHIAKWNGSIMVHAGQVFGARKSAIGYII